MESEELQDVSPLRDSEGSQEENRCFLAQMYYNPPLHSLCKLVTDFLFLTFTFLKEFNTYNFISDHFCTSSSYKS